MDVLQPTSPNKNGASCVLRPPVECRAERGEDGRYESVATVSATARQQQPAAHTDKLRWLEGGQGGGTMELLQGPCTAHTSEAEVSVAPAGGMW